MGSRLVDSHLCTPKPILTDPKGTQNAETVQRLSVTQKSYFYMIYLKYTALENGPKIPKSLNTSFISGLCSTLEQVSESAQCRDPASMATAGQHMVLC